MKSNLNSTSKREKELSEETKKLLADLIRLQRLEKELISNTEYILWLENFTIAHPCWSDDTWLYSPEEISKEDYEKVKQLHRFFNGIIDYAERNFIPHYYDEFGTYNFIKFNNIGYKIGVMAGQGSLTYCERIDISHDDNVFIDFNDIVNNKKQENVDYIINKFDSMYKIIEELISMGVSSETISTRLSKVLD